MPDPIQYPPPNDKEKVDYQLLSNNIMRRVPYNVWQNTIYFELYKNPHPIITLEPSKGVIIFEDMRQHPIIAACIEARFNSILKMEWEIASPSEDDIDVQRTEAIRWCFSQLNTSLWKGNFYLGGPQAFLAQGLEGIPTGYSIPQAIWNPSEGRIVETHHHDPRAFTFEADEDEQFGGGYYDWWTGTDLYYYTGAGIAHGKAKAPANKFMHMIYRPRHGSPWGNPALWPAYQPYILGFIDAVKMWLNFIDRWGQPGLIALIESTNWSDNEYVTRAVDWLSKLQTGFVGAAPTLSTGQRAFEAVESNRSSSNDIFMNFIDKMDRWIATSLIGAPLTIMESQYGTRAQASEQQEVRQDFVQGDADYLQSQMQIPIMWMYDAIFGKPFATPSGKQAFELIKSGVKPDEVNPFKDRGGYPTFKLKYEAKKDMAKEQQIAEGWQRMGFPFSEQYVAELNGYPLPDPKNPDEKIMQPAAAAPPGPMFPGFTPGGNGNGGAPPAPETEDEEEEEIELSGAYAPKYQEMVLRKARTEVAKFLRPSKALADKKKLALHGDHDQESHGSWSSGAGGSESGGSSYSSVKDNADSNLKGSLDDMERAGNWTLEETKKDRDSTTYEIIPQNIPDDYVEFKRPYPFDKSHGWYDPELATIGEGGRPTLKENNGWSQSVPAEVNGNLFRGLSAGEFAQIEKSGSIASSGSHNIGSDQVGLTYFSTDPSQAQSYASGFAPWQYAPSPGRPAYIVEITDPGTSVHVKGTGETERGVPGSISKNSVVNIYEGRAIAAEAGFIEAYKRYNGKYQEGSRSTPFVKVVWKKISGKNLAEAILKLGDFAGSSDASNRIIKLHGDHDQESHGSWSTGAGGSGDSESKIGRRTLGSKEHDWVIEEYSFGANPQAEEVKAVPLDANTLRAVWDDGSQGARSMLESKLGKIDVPSGKMLVYRMGSGQGSGLANRNAANMTGIVSFIEQQEERQMSYGNVLTAYLIPKPEEFAKYDEMTGASKRGKKMDDAMVFGEGIIALHGDHDQESHGAWSSGGSSGSSKPDRYYQGNRVRFTSGEFAGKTGKVMRTIAKRYNKEDTVHVILIDGFPKRGGWHGEVHVTPKDLEPEGDAKQDNTTIKLHGDHDQSSHGSWSSGGEGGGTTSAIADYKPERPLTGPDSKSISEVIPKAKAIEYFDTPGLSKMHEAMGIKDVSGMSGEYDKARKAVFAKMPSEKISFQNITFTQPRINLPRVEEIAKKGGPQLKGEVFVLRRGSQNYLLNGHHRVIANYLNGEDGINAKVFDAGVGLSLQDVLRNPLKLHGDHDQSSHGSWSTGASGGESSGTGSRKYAAPDPVRVAKMMVESNDAPEFYEVEDDETFAEIVPDRNARQEYVKAMDYMKSLKETHLIDTPDRVANRAKWADEYYNSNQATQKNREVWIIGGVPASGKSTISNDIVKENGAILIDPDQTANLIPETKGGGHNATHVEASGITKSILAKAVANGDNIVLPKNCSDTAKVEQMLTGFRSAGYTINYYTTHIPMTEAIRRNTHRVVRTGQTVPISYIRDTDGRPIKTHQIVKSTVDYHALYDTNVPLGSPPILIEGGNK